MTSDTLRLLLEQVEVLSDADKRALMLHLQNRLEAVGTALPDRLPARKRGWSRVWAAHPTAWYRGLTLLGAASACAPWVTMRLPLEAPTQLALLVQQFGAGVVFLRLSGISTPGGKLVILAAIAGLLLSFVPSRRLSGPARRWLAAGAGAGVALGGLVCLVDPSAGTWATPGVIVSATPAPALTLAIGGAITWLSRQAVV